MYHFFIFIFFSFFIFAENNSQFDFILNSENVRRSYLELKYLKNKNISIPNNIYYQLAMRSYLALRFHEALWAIDNISLTTDNEENANILYLKGLIYKDTHRYEEGIVTLKKVIFNVTYKSINSKNYIQEKSLLALIEIYFLKHGNLKTHKDVQYLINLFPKYFPNSIYITNLKNWK